MGCLGPKDLIKNCAMVEIMFATAEATERPAKTWSEYEPHIRTISTSAVPLKRSQSTKKKAIPNCKIYWMVPSLFPLSLNCRSICVNGHAGQSVIVSECAKVSLTFHFGQLCPLSSRWLTLTGYCGLFEGHHCFWPLFPFFSLGRVLSRPLIYFFCFFNKVAHFCTFFG